MKLSWLEYTAQVNSSAKLPKLLSSRDMIEESGAVQVTDEYVLSPSFSSKDGKTFWGEYHLFFYKENLETREELWIQQLKYEMNLPLDLDWDLERLESHYTKLWMKQQLYQESEDVYPDRKEPKITLIMPLDEMYSYGWFRNSPTKEKPYKLYICGNDDTSFSKFFGDKDDALGFIGWMATIPRDFAWFKENMSSN